MAVRSVHKVSVSLKLLALVSKAYTLYAIRYTLYAAQRAGRGVAWLVVVRSRNCRCRHRCSSGRLVVLISVVCLAVPVKHDVPIAVVCVATPCRAVIVIMFVVPCLGPIRVHHDCRPCCASEPCRVDHDGDRAVPIRRNEHDTISAVT